MHFGCGAAGRRHQGEVRGLPDDMHTHIGAVFGDADHAGHIDQGVGEYEHHNCRVHCELVGRGEAFFRVMGAALHA